MELLALYYLLIVPVVVLFGLFLPERKFNIRRVYKMSIFRITTIPQPSVKQSDRELLSVVAMSAIETVWEKYKYVHAPARLVPIC